MSSVTAGPGWTVYTMFYHMRFEKGGKPVTSNIYLAQGESSAHRSISFWYGGKDGVKPTVYHGTWAEIGPGPEGRGGLWLLFSGFGPGTRPDGSEWPLHAVTVHQSTDDRNKFEGTDHKQRFIELVHYNTFILSDKGAFDQCADDDFLGKRQRSSLQ